MICVTICDFGYDACRHAVRRCEKMQRDYPDIIAEIRLDLCGLDSTEVSKLFGQSKIPLMATCRRRSRNLYLPAILSGAAYIDIDAVTPKKEMEEILSAAGSNVQKIFSFHDYSRTPSIAEITAIIRDAAAHGADMIRIATMAGDSHDAERLLSLYRLQSEGEIPRELPIIAYAMGHNGTYSSLAAYSLGAPFLFCTIDERKALYPGMPSLELVEKLDKMAHIQGSTTIPCSKSVAQRMILASLIAHGTSVFHNFSSCDDTDVAVSIARQRGREVTITGDVLTIHGRGVLNETVTDVLKQMMGSSSISEKGSDTLFVGGSGLLARLSLPIAAQRNSSITIIGEGHLMQRDMVSCKDGLEKLGAKCILTAQGTLPAIVCGPLTGGDVTVSGKDGSQFASGLLMALPLSSKDSKVTVTDATDSHYFQLTIDIIKQFGIQVTSFTSGNNIIFQIPGHQTYSPVELSLEGDWSSAANFIVASAIYGNLVIKGLNFSSFQPDKKIVEAVRESGAEIAVEGYSVSVRRRHLHSFSFDVSQNTDLFPILSVLAAYCEGESVITGLQSVNRRDDRRVETLCRSLSAMGVRIKKGENQISITGISYVRRLLEGKRLKGGTVTSAGDHRVAMALSVAAIGCDSKLYIDDIDCIAKSFPSFRQNLAAITVKLHHQ